MRLHYVECGSGPLVLFLHGFPEFWYSWKDLLAEFGRDHRAVAVDLRGFNLSDAPEAIEAYRVPIIVKDVRALLSHLGERDAILVGHDWGGVIAWAFAAAHPALLERLVTINAPHPAVLARLLATDAEQQQASNYFNLYAQSRGAAEELLARDDFSALRRVVFGNWAVSEDRDRYLECWRRGLTGGLNYYRAANLKSPMVAEELEHSDFAHIADDVRVPTLVIWGERDFALMPSNLQGLESYVRDLTVHRAPDAGHWIVHEQPKRVIFAVRTFLAQGSAGHVD